MLIGTLAPFLLNVSALRHLPAARVGVVTTLEPVLATAIAWVVFPIVAAIKANNGEWYRYPMTPDWVK